MFSNLNIIIIIIGASDNLVYPVCDKSAESENC